MSNYYEILGIGEDATEEEIKRAYFKLIRKYPPEKFPKEVSEINEAYSVLSDNKKRIEYDEERKREPFIELMEQVNVYINDNDYYSAIKVLKKIILAGEDSAKTKNMLSVCYYRTQQYEKSYETLLEIINKGENVEEVYFENLYISAIEIKKILEVEKYLKKAVLIFDNAASKKILCEMYYRAEDFDNSLAREILVNKIDPCVDDGSLAYSDLLDLCKLAYYLGENNLSIKYFELFNEYYSSEDNIEKLSIMINYLKEIIFDGKIKLAVKYFKIIEKNFNDLSNDMIIKLKCIKNILYDVDEIENNAKIVNELKIFLQYKLIAMIDYEYIKEEYESYLKTLENVVIEKPDAIKASITLIKNNYKETYNYFNEIFDELYNIAYESIRNIHENKETVSRNQKSSSNNESGCLVIFIFCAIGAYLGGPVGFIIALIILYFILNKS